MEKGFVLTLDFGKGMGGGVDYINQALSGISLSDIGIEESRGHLTVQYAKEADDETVTLDSPLYFYDFNKISFSCTPANEEERHYFQMDATVREKTEFKDFLDEWKNEHPDCQTGCGLRISFEQYPDVANLCAYIIMYRKKTNGE
ncbi:MAG: hypothetical protein II877_04020 [Synergistaceae bacterium]|nr:hypothetical protein [Synergistaceae bacterium]MBQ7169665.1 hypothetical protein [Synergistaceae bacterium]